MLSSVTISTVYAGEPNSVRLDIGDCATFPGTLYNYEADAEYNLVLIENEEYEKALWEAVDSRNKFFFWAIGGTVTTILLLLK